MGSIFMKSPIVVSIGSMPVFRRVFAREPSILRPVSLYLYSRADYLVFVLYIEKGLLYGGMKANYECKFCRNLPKFSDAEVCLI